MGTCDSEKKKPKNVFQIILASSFGKKKCAVFAKVWGGVVIKAEIILRKVTLFDRK